MLTVTLTGELADWVQAQASQSVRTESQQVEYLLLTVMKAEQRRRQQAEERKVKRKALRASWIVN